MARLDGGEYFHQFGDHCACEGSTGNNRSQLPPLAGVAAEFRNDELGDDVGEHDRDDRCEPYQRGERRFVVHVVGIAVARFGYRFIQEVGEGAGHQHHDAHNEDPYQ